MAELSRVRMLVVDDDPSIFRVLRDVADEHPVVDVIGHASSPQDAFAMSRADPPDAIVLDHGFPDDGNRFAEGAFATSRGMSGLEAVQYLRSILPTAIIAVYSGMSGLGISAHNAGADLYLEKGGDPSLVLDEVARFALERGEA